MPANVNGVHVDPTEWNRNDGFSPGEPILLSVPGIDLAKTGAAPITDMAQSLDHNAPIVLIDENTGRRWPYWAELDANAPTPDQQLLVIRPAKNFPEGHRIIVGLRNLRDANGNLIPAPAAFTVYRDHKAHDARTPAMQRIFADLNRAGVRTRDLYLAWDFTIASEQNLAQRLLSMRDQAFAQLGNNAPSYAISSAVDNPRAGVMREISGTFQVPRFLTGDGGPGTVLNNGNDPHHPLPAPNGTQTANFLCEIPASAIGTDGSVSPTHLTVYGHGLFGSASEVKSVSTGYGSGSNTTVCGTDWIGMSGADVPTAITALQDFSKFRTIPDRLQQADIDFLFLARLLDGSTGFRTNPAFQDGSGHSLLGTDIAYTGNSQGGILGGSLSSVAQDWTRVFLGVPAMNYSTLLQRSVDYDVYALVLNASYTNEVDRELILSLAQMLWDRGENDGYAEHLTSDPYERTPRKTVLMFEAFGDHQVTNVATEVMARTIGAHVRQPALAPGRSPAVTPFWDIPAVPSFPFKGSALVMWDFGTPAPPTANLPNRAGQDPHGLGRNNPDVIRMVANFLKPDGALIDVCGGQPCHSTS
jgi:hypothetical protein